jgi:Flp pilus assembly protein TadG
VLRPLIQRSRSARNRERGVTMALVAISLLAIISMAAISIDLGSLYEAKAEAQRAADLAALAAARFLSLEGVTGDPANNSGSWAVICDGIGSPASVAAITVAKQNFVNGVAPPTVMVYYGTDTGVPTNQSCLNAGTNFGVNPVVQVYVQQPTLPTYFARIFSLLIPGAGGNSGVSATAVAEVFNSSGTGALPSGMVPVQPRCVKPWIVPNVDPGNASNAFVKPDGTIVNPGILQLPPGTGVIGESFTINADCMPGATNCEITPTKNILDNPPTYNGANNPTPKILEYVPSLIPSTLTPVAVASNANCSLSNAYQSVIAGCDQTTVYACGTLNGSTVDLTENPLNPAGSTGDSPTGASCLINQGGADALAGYPSPITYPFQILAGSGNPLAQAGAVNSGDSITVSNSIVTLPIVSFPVGGMSLNQSPVTIVGFLQVFIDGINADGSMPVTVLNVAGCSTAPTNSPILGTSPVPIRLITPP